LHQIALVLNIILHDGCNSDDDDDDDDVVYDNNDDDEIADCHWHYENANDSLLMCLTRTGSLKTRERPTTNTCNRCNFLC